MLSTHCGQFTWLFSWRDPFPCAGVGPSPSMLWEGVLGCYHCLLSRGLHIPMPCTCHQQGQPLMPHQPGRDVSEPFWQCYHHHWCLNLNPEFCQSSSSQISANSCTVQLLCCFPAADVCPSHGVPKEGPWRVLCADLRGPKGLILNLRAVLPRARIQADCAVKQPLLRGRRFWIPLLASFPEVYPKETRLQFSLLCLKLGGVGSDGQLLWAFHWCEQAICQKNLTW